MAYITVNSNGQQLVDAVNEKLDSVGVNASITSILGASTGAGLVGFTPSGTIDSTNVQDAILEISSDLAGNNGSSLVGYTPNGVGAITIDVQTRLREHDAQLENVEGNLNFGTLPSATLPVSDVDLLLLRQGADNKKIQISEIIDRVTDAVMVDVSSAVVAAELAEANAESARDSAFINANVYTSTSTGLAAVALGEQFSVVSGDQVIRYREDAGPVATEVARFPAKDFVDKLTLFPGRGNWVAPEPVALARILSLQLYGTDPAKFYFVKYHFWKDVGTRYTLTIQRADDDIGTGAIDVATRTLTTGADAWNTIREVDLIATGGSGVTGTAQVDFRDPTALTMNVAPTTSAMFQRRVLSSNVLQIGAARQADIGARAASALGIRNQSGLSSAFAGASGNDTLTGQRNTGFGYFAADS